MRERVFKISVILAIILTMTMSNFIIVGNGLISYAQEQSSTNNQNVEFKAFFKNEQGQEVEKLERNAGVEQNFLYLQVDVNKEGFFNGSIGLSNNNFNLKNTDSNFVSKIKDNTIYLNQVNVGTTGEIKVEIEPIEKEDFDIGFLNVMTNVELNGIYRDSKQKDIKIEAKREVMLQLAENNSSEDVVNDLNIISNKTIMVQGEEKRMIQVSFDMGLKQNNYPIKEIKSKVQLPKISGHEAQIEKVAYLNDMKTIDYKVNKDEIDLTLKNNPDEQNKVNWKTEGNDSVVITCVYDKDADLENTKITAQETVTLFNDKKLDKQADITIGKEQLDNTLELQSRNKEKIFKGKINAGIEKQIETATTLKINYAKTVDKINISEDRSNYKAGDANMPANVAYRSTSINKNQFNDIFGANGNITLFDQDRNVIGIINSEIEADEKGNIRIDYDGRDVRSLTIETSKPEKEGIIEFVHRKAIKEDAPIANEVNELRNKITTVYNDIEGAKTVETSLGLENASTKVELTTNIDSLSTVISNNLEMKVLLRTNNEKYELFKDPEVILQLPEQVENITINGMDLLYDEELSIRDYTVDGRMIHIYLSGDQTNYKEKVIDGATILINATVDVNRKVATSDESINLAYANQKGATGKEQIPLKIVAPTELTAIQSIQKLGIETIGQEENKEIMMKKAIGEQTLETELEIINNKKEEIQNVKVLGEFPTDHGENNMGIKLTKGIQLQNAENAKIYYTENEEATDDIENSDNKWTENLDELKNASKYLILADKINGQDSMLGNYQYSVPANLEYNKKAETSYIVKSTSSATNVESEEKSTNIEMQTGIGPKVDTKLTAKVGGDEIRGTVKNGEVIEYKIEVSNVGSEDIEEIKVKGNVPEGTTLVRGVDYYEYTGAYYYEELEDREFEGTIKNLKVGDTRSFVYEVKVNKDTAEGTELNGKTEVFYGDAKKENEVKNITTAKGDLSVSVKRVTDRKGDVYAGGVVQYYAMIENITDKKQENVKIRTNIPENVEVGFVELYTGMGKYRVISQTPTEDGSGETLIETEAIVAGVEDSEPEELEYKDEFSIGDLNPGETKVLCYYLEVGKIAEEDKIMNFSVTAIKGNVEYKSNRWEEKIKDFDINISMTSNTESQYVKSGDVIDYVIKVENTSDSQAEALNILDTIPLQLTVNKIFVNDQEIEVSDENDLDVDLTTPGHGTDIVKVEASVDYSESRDEAEAITNIAYAEVLGERVAATSEVTHIIQAEEFDDQEEEENVINMTEEELEEMTKRDREKYEYGEPSEEETSELEAKAREEEQEAKARNEGQEGDKIITGIAWFDENANGQKDDGEDVLGGINVKLLNIDTNTYVKEAKTNGNGIYVIDKITAGKYIVVFEYDNTKYGLTKYKASGVSDAQNSKVILNDLTVNNETQKLASTDIIDVTDNNISGINLGLIELKNFDLSLNKFVNRILIQTSAGTVVKQFNNETIAKAEIDAKQVNGATVVIEYKIAVTNNGEIDGYVKKIADYVPSDLKFSSELNKDWYQVGNVLYTNVFANDKIAAGETKEITLTLSKAMTENNTGLVANTAEIAEDYNELGMEDGNSTPGNRIKEENDFGEAQALLSIRTGGVVYVTSTIIIIVAIAAAAMFIIKRKKTEKGGE